MEKRYAGGIHAVRDFCLEVADGELLALVGPSGCGKSTVLRLLAGLETVSAGTLRIADGVVNDLAPQERNVAMVFQDYALYPTMSVRENLAFPLRMRRASRAEVERRVAEVARLLEIEALLDRRPAQLSGGQRQRVSMGRALVREPAVFLLDEPLSNLDARLRGQVRGEIAELRRRTGTTMLYVTHDQVEAMTLGDRVAVLHEGRLQQVDTPETLYARPANAFVAGFIGSPPMNLVPATLADGGPDGGLHLDLGVGRVALPPDARRALPAAGASPLTAGFRPEAVDLACGDVGEKGLPARVRSAEYVGHETLVHATLGAAADGAPVVARLPGKRSFAAGAPVALVVDAAAVHLFAPDGGAIF